MPEETTQAGTRLNGVAGDVELSNWKDLSGNPAGGFAGGVGFVINWQDGPVNRDVGEVASGAFVEDVTLAVIERIRFFQDGYLACEENKQALHYLTIAHEWMMERRKDRADRRVLGKYEA